MNYRMTGYILGVAAAVEAALMFVCLIVAAVCSEGTVFAFGISALVLAAAACPLIIKKPVQSRMEPRGGLVTVALCWLFMSLSGTMPVMISREIPNFIDAFFEMASGFTTTGATIAANVENFSMSINLWRVLTHWIGGMGILVFVIALLPKAGAQAIHVFKAESPGPQAGKLAVRLGATARILYGIYLALTVILTVLLKIGGMSFFDSVIHAMSTVSTGGFSNKTANIAYYNSGYIEVVITVFMLLSSVNFNLYYLILIGRAGRAVKSEELRLFAIIFALAVIGVGVPIALSGAHGGESLRYSAFTVASAISTTGFSVAKVSAWPVFCQIILLLIGVVGGCAGSTAGGFKVSRLLILGKAGKKELKLAVSPRSVSNVKLEGRSLDTEVINAVFRYLFIYVGAIVFSVLAVSLSFTLSGGGFDAASSFSAVISCINNIGSGNFAFENGSYAAVPYATKLILSFVMIIGRLEIIPMVMLFYRGS